MVNIIIYYCLNENETNNQAIEEIQKLISKLENKHIIKGVFIDSYNERHELTELLNSCLSNIDFLYLNKKIIDEFDFQLITELARNENFKIEYFY